MCLKGRITESLRKEQEPSSGFRRKHWRDAFSYLQLLMAKMSEDQEFLEYLIKALVDNPSAVKTDRKVDEMGVLITLKVDPADMGKIIGRAGQTAKAIRMLLRVVGIKNNARVNLKIEEPEGGRGPRPRGERSRGVDEVVDDLRL